MDRNPPAGRRARPSIGRRIGDFFFGYDFFISYAHADGNRYPRALAERLEERGFKVFLDESEYPAGEDGGVSLWRIDGDRLDPAALAPVDRELSSLALSPDGSLAAAGTEDGKRVMLWDARSGRLLRTMDANHSGPVEALAFGPDGAHLVSGGAATATFLWDVGTGAAIAQLDQHKQGVRAVAFSPDGRSLATAAEGGRVVLWALDAMPPSHRVLAEGSLGYVSALAFSPDGRRLAAGGQGEAVLIWNLERGAADPARLAGSHAGEVTRLRFVRAGAALAVRTQDGRIAFYDPSSGGDLAVWDTGQGRIVATHPRPRAPPPPSGETAGKPLPSGTDLRGIRPDPRARVGGLCRVAGGGPAALCTVDNTPADAVAISAAADAFYYGGGAKGCVFRWTERDGWLAQPLFEHGSSIGVIAVSADGHRIATGGSDGSLGLWEIVPAVRRAGFDAPAPDRRITALAFSAGGERLLIGGGRFEVARDGSVMASATDPDVSFRNDPRIAIWDLDPASWVASACALVGRGFTVDESRRFLLGVHPDPCATP